MCPTNKCNFPPVKLGLNHVYIYSSTPTLAAILFLLLSASCALFRRVSHFALQPSPCFLFWFITFTVPVHLLQYSEYVTVFYSSFVATLISFRLKHAKNIMWRYYEADFTSPSLTSPTDCRDIPEVAYGGMSGSSQTFPRSKGVECGTVTSARGRSMVSNDSNNLGICLDPVTKPSVSEAIKWHFNVDDGYNASSMQLKLFPSNTVIVLI